VRSESSSVLQDGLEAAPAGGRLLIVDDDPGVRDSVGRALSRAGYSVAAVGNGSDAVASVARSPVDLIVLDVLMPAVDGLDVCRMLRARGDSTPVLMLTARDSTEDLESGLAAGADDYLVKPFALRELVARIRALLRRSQMYRDVIGYADLTLNVSARTAVRGDTAIDLTRIEFDLLELLLRNAERVLSYEVIMDRVWGFGEAPESNTLQVFVSFLRRKLEQGERVRLVHNVRGVGYVLRAAA
jgi:two-component system, OmpR family, response regulator MprA